jgi:hypothetical protein
MRSRGFKELQKAVRKETEIKNAEYQYKLYDLCVDDMFKAAAACMIATLHRRELSKQYIQRFFKDFCYILSFPETFGMSKGSDEMMKEYAKLYDIDFDKIHVCRETLEEYKKRYKIGDEYK